MTNLKNKLREWYIADLRRTITRGNGREGPRARKPSVYERHVDYPNPRNITISDNVWVSSDLHFDHKNIIDFSDRPFMNIDEMNEALIANHNDYVQPDDIWLCVGDVGFCGVERTRELIAQMNGYKILVIGNHDVKKKQIPDIGFDEVHLLYYLDTPSVGLVFTHYPMFNLPAPLINIHGHLHKNFDLDSPQHINVCCEYHGYKPISLQTLAYWAVARVGKFGLEMIDQRCLICEERHAQLTIINENEVKCPFCQALYNYEDMENINE